MSKKNISLIVSVIIAVYYAYSSFSSQGSTLGTTTTHLSPTTSQVTTVSGQYIVSKVVDGDTIKVTDNGSTYTVRLIGLDTPETVDPRKKVQCFGKEASDYLKNLISEKSVRLIADPTQQQSDKYGRWLRYVFLTDGMFVNKQLISDGYAYEYTYDVPYQYQEEFKEVQKVAQLEGKGLWSSVTCSGKR